eukprot:scaffold83352_cov63-Phaeocystis_antarctica.AAC.3
MLSAEASAKKTPRTAERWPVRLHGCSPGMRCSGCTRTPVSLEPLAMKSESADHSSVVTSSPCPPNVSCSAKGTNERSSAGVAHTCVSRPSANATHLPSGEKRTSAAFCLRLRWWMATRRGTLIMSRWPSSSIVSRIVPSGESARRLMFRRASNGKVEAGDPVAHGTVQRAAVRAEHEVTLPVDRAAQVAEGVIQPRHGELAAACGGPLALRGEREDGLLWRDGVVDGTPAPRPRGSVPPCNMRRRHASWPPHGHASCTRGSDVRRVRHQCLQPAAHARALVEHLAQVRVAAGQVRHNCQVPADHRLLAAHALQHDLHVLRAAANHVVNVRHGPLHLARVSLPPLVGELRCQSVQFANERVAAVAVPAVHLLLEEHRVLDGNRPFGVTGVHAGVAFLCQGGVDLPPSIRSRSLQRSLQRVEPNQIRVAAVPAVHRLLAAHALQHDLHVLLAGPHEIIKVDLGPFDLARVGLPPSVGERRCQSVQLANVWVAAVAAPAVHLLLEEHRV